MIIALIFLIAAGASAFFVLPSFIPRLDAISSNPNPLIRHFSPTWRSIKKIADIPYLLAGALRSKDSLPRYEIELTKKDLSNLLNNLPNYPKENRLNEEFKKTIKAEFRYGSYATNDAKIRYRGTSPNHWNAIKKSWQVNLPKEMPLGDRTILRFFIGEDKGWIKGFLWNHLAEKLNLMTPKIEAVELVINRKPMGVYMLVEGWEESFLEKRGRQLGRFMTNKSLAVSKLDFYRPESAFQWYDRFEEKRSGETFPELNYFLSLVGSAPDDIFEKEIENILDMDIFLHWTLAVMLSGDFDQLGNGANINFYINPATGKFEPIFFDAALNKLSDPIDLKNHRVVNRVLAIKRYREMFEAIAVGYVSDSKNLADDLAFYDAAEEKILPAIYRDSAKIQTSFEAKQKIRADREAYEHNFLTLKGMLEGKGTLQFRYADKTYPLPKTTKHFLSFETMSVSRGEFLAANPQFVAGQNADMVILLPGTYTFSRDVIIPHGLRVFIREDVHIFFGPSVSLLSYSPVTATATFSQPISFNPLSESQPWGVVSVINTGKKNIFTNVHIIGGKDATINGVYFSGMLSVHGGDLEFRSGSIRHASADDGIHVVAGEAIITDSLFADNNADGIDIDFAKKKSRIAGNIFTLSPAKHANANGDAMDLSFSSLIVENNTVEHCSDKGVSVGEASTLVIQNNTIKNCAYGVAVKDRSEAIIKDNAFEQNKTAVGLYRKKPHFVEGGKAALQENTFVNNETNITVDAYSRIMDAFETRFQK